MVGFAPLNKLLADVYQVDENWTTMLTLSYFGIFVLLNFPANKIIEAYGIAVPIRIASACFISGAWLRLLSRHSFWFILGGQ